MTRLESVICQAWIGEHSEEWDAIDFNVRLGEGMEFEREVDAETRRIGQLLSQKRADLIVTTLHQVAIIEVKIRLGPTAIGELLVYRHLWLRQDRLRRPVRMIGIARNAVPDIQDLLTELGIETEYFPRVAGPEVSL